MTIYVGIDENDASVHALTWALRESLHRQTPVLAVHVWHVPAWDLTSNVPLAEVTKTLEEQARHVATTVLEKAKAEVGRDVRALAISAPGMAGPTLVRMTERADLLVVGKRNYGTIKRALLGSVSSYCVHHARCPVTVVPHGDDKS